MGCVPLCGAPSGSLHTIVTLSEDFPMPQEALDAVPTDEPLHRGADTFERTRTASHALLAKTRAP